METLQGLSASELASADGRRWRTNYSDPDHTVKEGLDNTVWPAAFERMERFIRDTGLNRDDLDLNYDNVVELFKSGKLADVYKRQDTVEEREAALDKILPYQQGDFEGLFEALEGQPGYDPFPGSAAA